MPDPDRMVRYYISDRLALGGSAALIDNIARQLRLGIELIQLRERDLSARDLDALAGAVLRLPNPHGTRILVNDRTDVALAAGAAGVHLRGNSPPPARIRVIAPADFLIGVSCHSVDDVCRAEQEGGSFAVLAPIFPTAGKGPPLGLAPLAQAARRVRMPVLALGGISAQRIRECVDAGAAGIAGISLFQRDST